MASQESTEPRPSFWSPATLGTLVLGALVLGAALYLIWRIREVLVMVLLAVVLAYLLKPVVDLLSSKRLGRLRISRSGAALIAFALLLFVLAWIVVLLMPSVVHDVDNLQARWSKYQKELPALIARAQSWYEAAGIPQTARGVIEAQVRAAGDFLAERAKRVLGVTFKGLSLIVELFLVPILAFYFVSDLPSVKEGLLFFMPSRWRAGAEAALHDVDEVFNRYIQAQLLLCFIAFVVVTVGLYAVDMNFYLTLGLLAGVTRAIPVIGPIFGGIPIVALALLRSTSLGLWLLVAFIGLHIVESKYVMPKVLGFRLGIHPVVIILSLLIGYQFFGLIGMFVAVPIVASIQRILQRHREAQASPQP
jgi:predicted PurR-regulated permease PerM